MPSEIIRRVLARFAQATQEDLGDLLVKYRQKVAAFGRYDAQARSIVEKYEQEAQVGKPDAYG